MRFTSFSIAGPKGDNQDAILPPFEAGSCTWCAIADGVGSSALGGLAARTSVEALQGVTGLESMVEVFAHVQNKLVEVAREHEPSKSVSTTLSVLRICGERATVGHVGDTRISHYRGKGVMARTKDQTEVQRLLDDGALTKHQAARYPRRNVLLSAMSAGREYDLYEENFSVEAGDRILLTSDGFHGKLLRGRIAKLSAFYAAFEDFESGLREALSEVTIEDDASCLVIEIG
jgi:serine/threonine protein phosphatase PrpC